MLGDLKSPRLMYLKAALFVVLGLASLVLVGVLSRDWRVIVLAIIAVWACSRAYYFAFYVIERYIDPSQKFDGLYAVVLYLLRSSRRSVKEDRQSGGAVSEVPPSQWRVYIARTDELLLKEWDPIGINDEPMATDEYSSYAPRMLRIALHSGVESVADELEKIRVEHMGLPAKRAADRRIAMRLIDLADELRTSVKDKPPASLGQRSK